MRIVTCPHGVRPKKDCRQCKNQKRQAHRKARPDLAKAYSARYRTKNAEKLREKQRLALGIVTTRPEPKHCELCGDLPVGKKGLDGRITLSADHCHATGKFRGWLCAKCNSGLGMFKDNPALLKLAALYLETTP